MNEVLTDYSKPGEITSLDKYKEFTNWLTADPSVMRLRSPE